MGSSGSQSFSVVDLESAFFCLPLSKRVQQFHPTFHLTANPTTHLRPHPTSCEHDNSLSEISKSQESSQIEMEPKINNNNNK